MPWLFKRKNSPFWWIGYYHPNSGDLVRKSTGLTVEAEAKKELAKLHHIERAADDGLLTEEFYRAVCGKKIGSLPLKPQVDAWLAGIKAVVSEGTLERYRSVGEQFCTFLHATDAKPLLTQLGPEQVRDFMAHLREGRSVSSVNLARAILSVFFNHCLIEQKIAENPVKRTKTFRKVRGETVERRPFTTEELTKIFAIEKDLFWDYMVNGAFYTGLRMGDLICLRRSEVVLKHNLLEVEPIKTEGIGKTVRIPIARLFRIAIEKRMEKCTTKQLWPEQADLYARRGAGPFSAHFRKNVLVKAGLCEQRDYSVPKKDKRHLMSEISFHSLRHNFVTLLIALGAPKTVVKELAGHSSDRVSDIYTHIPLEMMHKAIALLPELSS